MYYQLNLLTRLLFILDRMTPCLLLSMNPLQTSNNAKTNIIHFYQLSQNPFYVSHTPTNSLYSMFISNNDAFALPQQ